ncbi:MAG: hypothetical protein KDD94_15055, partial [Calditrichaeota bacterium]|nr:hypothetical protein [Calditrichota bacterium]
GSLSQEYILILQALKNFTFKGPNAQNEIQFEFLSDRIWSDNNIKEILTFKILPRTASKADLSFTNGTGPYLSLTAQQNEENIVYFYKNPTGNANLENVRLMPFIDNSTFATELSNKNINVMLSTPFGSLSSILADTSDYFYKSKISTTFFAVFFNTERVPLEKRKAYRAFLNNKKIMNEFFKVGTPQQRNITDYLGNSNNFNDYLNYSVFPQSSYYVEEKIVVPDKNVVTPDNSQLTGLDIKVNLNSGLREELNELMTILNNQNLFQNKVKVTAVREDAIAAGDYDAVIIPIRGYSSKIRYDLYDLFFRSPDLVNYRVNMRTRKSGNETVLDPSVIQVSNNFFRINGADQQFTSFLQNIYGFMATQHIGDKQYYAGLIDEQERSLALATWLFSLPELSYYSRQFNEHSVQQYGVATQLSTIEKWQEKN